MARDFHLSKANVKKFLRELSLDRTDQVTEGILSEGRIFFLGRFDVDQDLFERSQSVLSNLAENVKQPFGTHPWVFCMDVKWPEHDNYTTVVGKLDVFTPDFLSCGYWSTNEGQKMLLTETWDFSHTTAGFGAKRLSPMGFNFTGEFAPTCYMIAISCLNTRGCSVVRSEPLKGIKKLRSNHVQHYDVDASEYITAIRTKNNKTNQYKGVTGTRRSPIPHLRRAHERIINGQRVWIRDMLVNVRSEDDIAFVDKRIAYVAK